MEGGARAPQPGTDAPSQAPAEAFGVEAEAAAGISTYNFDADEEFQRVGCPLIPLCFSLSPTCYAPRVAAPRNGRGGAGAFANRQADVTGFLAISGTCNPAGVCGRRKPKQASAGEGQIFLFHQVG